MSANDSAPNYAALADFRHQIRSFLAVSAEAARAAGIDPTQHQLLLVLKAHGSEPATIGTIAERLMIRHHSAVELVTRCERNGWVERERDTDDRRMVHVLLTRKGKDMLKELSSVHVRELQTAGPRLIHTLLTILDRVPELSESNV